MDLESNNFLLSNWYSGATVLSILLNNHKNISCNGETLPFPDQSIDNLICSCTKPISKCDFYNYSAKHFINDERFFSRMPLLFQVKFLQKLFKSYNISSNLRNFICELFPGYKSNVMHFIEMHESFF